MTTDFLDAHERHFSDAEYLIADNRLPNADQLYGFCAETGLKRLMQCFGMKMHPLNHSPALGDDRVHADKIWIRYETYRSGHAQGIRYSLPALNPFFNWNASQRYAASASIPLANVHDHKVGAEKVYKLIKMAMKDGLL